MNTKICEHICACVCNRIEGFQLANQTAQRSQQCVPAGMCAAQCCASSEIFFAGMHRKPFRLDCSTQHEHFFLSGNGLGRG